MNAFPSYKVMIVTVLLVTIGFSIKFITTSKQQFFQLNFDWNKEKTLKKIGIIELDSVSYNYVKISNNNKYNPSPQHTYKLTAKNNSYYFRYVFAIKDKTHLEFKGTEWITDIPEITDIKYELEEVFLPLKEHDGPTLITIGDDLLIENEAKYFRKDIAGIYPIVFKGNFSDVFNFSHQAIKQQTSADILEEINEVSPADYYLLMYGINENLDSLKTFQTNAKKIIHYLQTKQVKKIILVMLPPSMDANINQKNSKINEIFLKLSNYKNVEYIDTFQLFSGNLDKYIRQDSISISRSGYYELAKETAKKLK